MIGDILDGKYRIDKHLGAGGMGNVYLATHLGTTRVVAVKVIAPRWSREPQFLARFQREAQACGRLRHPNIVNVTDFGIAKTAAGDMPYLVMEFLDGQTLSDFHESNPQLPLPMVADILDQVGLALTEAHRHGIIHRDLKPDNIWLEPNGRGGYTAKVLDFGVAKVNLLSDWAPSVQEATPLGASGIFTPRGELETLAILAPAEAGPSAVRAVSEQMETAAIEATPSSHSSGSFDSGASAQTMPGSLLGTPAYMSPEQALGKEIDFRSDIYAMAVVAYLLVYGELPFKRSASEFLEYHQSDVPALPTGGRKIPRDVADAILAGLARNPADRPASAVAFARRFHNAVDAEFLALRRSKAFLLQHLTAYALLVVPIYTIVLSVTGLMIGAAGDGDSFCFFRQPASRRGSVNGCGRTSPDQAVFIVPSLLEAGEDDTGAGCHAGSIDDVLWTRLGSRRLLMAGNRGGGEAFGKGRHPAIARSDDRFAVRRPRPRDSSPCTGRLRVSRGG
jgi:serine/threonine protein kinase